MRYFDSITTKRKIVGFTIITTILTFLLGHYHGRIMVEIIISLSFFLLLLLCKPIWLSEDNSKKIQNFLFFLALFILASYSGWNPYLSKLVSPILQENFKEHPVLEKIVSPVVMVVIFYIIGVISYLIRDNTVMKISGDIDKEFPEKDFKTKLIAFSKVIENNLTSIDQDVNWSDFYFTPLEAEVEVISNNKKIKKVVDLLRGLKSDRRSQVFLIIGDPGSGKSTALRKLAKDLLKEVKKTWKIPIYINLKDWQSNTNWTESTQPQPQDIYKFVVANLKQKGDLFSNRFIDTYFEKMYEHGRLFFLLDSFDEIPEVLDANENSFIIDSLSDVFYRFLTGMNLSRGILASRIFRKPTKKFKAKTTLEIRPFSEMKIQQTFANALNNIEQDFFSKFFKSKSELVPLARNPFTATLIIQYLEENNYKMPENQASIYYSYIDKRLHDCEEKIKEYNLSVDEIFSFATDISYFIFKSQKFGLEISFEDIPNEFDLEKANSIVSVLSYAKICRQSNQGKKFSFVHRRFNEYFVVLKILEDPSTINFEVIPSDSRWRDALVLFCELADEDYVKQLMAECWIEIGKLNSEGTGSKQLLRSIHCLRFISDAFRGRKNLLTDYQNDLFDFIVKNIVENNNLLVKKFSMEAITLLNEENTASAIIKAFETNNSWLEEEAFKASRYLNNVTFEMQKTIIRYLDSFYVLEYRRKKSRIIFSTSLSDGFKPVNFVAKLLQFDSSLFLMACFIIILIQPNWLLLYFSIIITRSLYTMNIELSSVFNFDYFRLKTYTSFMSFALMYTMLYVPSKVLDGGGNYAHPFLNWDKISFLSKYYYATLPIKVQQFYKILSILAFVLSIPFIHIFIYFKYKILKYPKITYELIVFLAKNLIIPALLLCFVFEAYIYFFTKNIIYVILIINYINIILFLLVIILAYYLFDEVLFDMFRDFKKYKKFAQKYNAEKSIARVQIQNELSRLKTTAFRLKFLQFIDNNSILPTGEWENDKFPNFWGESGILLARMEEKWLNLDR